MTDRLLLCRPQGGLNDMLCQIEKCCAYAEQTGRLVVVDSGYAHATHFNDDLGRYFASRQRRLLLSPDTQALPIEELPVFPAFLQGRINSYSARFDPGLKAMCDTSTGQPLTFDFRKDYPHPLLVHHQAGGGTASLFALLRMTLNPALVDELLARVRSMDGPWVGVHVRHTDYSTDYQPLLDQLRQAMPPRLLLATDSQQVLDHFRSALVKSRICSFTEALSPDGQPLHMQAGLDAGSAYRRNRDALLDLLMLALSQQLVFQRIRANPWGATYSGFSLLAQQLWKSRIVLKHLIADPRIDFGLG